MEREDIGGAAQPQMLGALNSVLGTVGVGQLAKNAFGLKKAIWLGWTI
jgi:hypothetical protein